MPLERAPVARAEMRIRKPAGEVFQAFIDPAVTTRFWFTRSSGRLEPGKTVRWDWEMYGASTSIQVIEVEPDRRILIEWDDPATRVEWLFAAQPDGSTFVTITNSGFGGDDDEVVQQALDSTGGFAFVLAGLKALLEHGVELNLVGDHSLEARTVS